MPEFLKPWRMALPLLGFLLLAAIWSGYWMWASSAAQNQIATWRAEAAAQNVTLDCGQENWGGYPFRVELRCSPGKITFGNQAIAFTELTIMAQAYDLKHILLLNDGDTILNLGQGDVRFAHEGAIASVLLNKNGHAQFDAEFTNITAPDFSAQRLALHARLQSTLDLAATLETAELKLRQMDPAAIDSFSVVANVDPVPEKMDFKTMAEEASTLAIGQIELTSAAIRYSGAGDFTINSQGRPQGKLTGRLQNFDHVLQALADRGILEENARMGAGALLGLLGGNSPDGMRIEIAANQGGLYIGPFRIVDLPPLF